MRAQILICGTDSILLSTRRDVLRSVGCDVLTASHWEEIETLVQARIVDALVICHTLDPAQQQAAVTVLHRYCPNAKSIILTKSSAREISARPDAVVSAVEGPRTLIKTLEHLLHIPLRRDTGVSSVPDCQRA